ncbi:MAG: hypothetical protein IJV65_09215 [Kiritimatiellae bacterium]|nr:hypothetical protein [Kiritimatiellia bacterium]
MRRRAALPALAAVLAAALPAAAQEAPPPSGEERPVRLTDEQLERIRALYVRSGAADSLPSSDGTIRVSGATLPHADRAALMEFVSDLRDALETKLGARGASPAEAAAVSFRTDDFRILVRAAPDPAGTNRPARVEIALDPNRAGRDWQHPLVATVWNPANDLDAHELGDGIVRGLLDLKVLSAAWDAADAGRAPAADPVPFPAWFGSGLARSLDPATRQDDFDRVRDALASGRLPPLASLLAADAPTAASPVLASQLVEFWLSRPGRPARFAALRDALAAGTPWSPRLFLSTCLGSARADPAAAAADFAAWVQERATHVLSPGETTDSLVARTFAAMRLVPGRGGVPEGVSDGPMALERLLEPDTREWAPAAARALKADVLRLALGRGDAYREACDRFAAFFDEAARPNPDIGRAMPLLREARALLSRAADEP